MIGSVGRGGAEELLTELLVRCRPRIEPLLVTLSAARESEARLERLHDARVRRVVLSPGRGHRVVQLGRALGRLHRVIRRFRPHVASAWLEESSALLIPIARLHRLPVVTVRLNVGGSPSERSALTRIAVRETERRATLVVCLSEAVMADARGRGIEPVRLRLVRNGCVVLPSLPAPQAPEVALGYVAQFRPEKGHVRLLDALARLHTPVPWRVDLAGDGPLLEEVRAESIRRGLGERVDTLGHISDVREFWRERSVAVLLSDFEGGGQALIEAAMAGRPMVGTDSGATREVIAPGTGFLVPLDDPGKAAAALQRLIEDPALRSRMGEEAHRHASQQFSMERYVDGHVSALREARALSDGRSR